jgi:hypothetical protein
LPAIASRVRNVLVLRSSKKVNMTPIDHINQQAVATYVKEKPFGQEIRASKELE